LPHLSAYVTARRAIHAHYSRALSHLPGVQLPQLAAGDSAWLTTLHLDPATARATPEQLRLALAEHRIEARPIWKPMHLQPLYQGARCFGGAVAERLFATGLCLPSGSALTTAQLERICAVIARVLS
jgi:pyridoxal phosphate-dependent aminotransferase EpsN